MSLGKGCHARLVSLDTDNLLAPTGQIPSACRCVTVPITEGEERHQHLGTTLPMHLNFREADTLILLTTINQVRPNGKGNIICFCGKQAHRKKAPLSSLPRN